MRLHCERWGQADKPTLVCVHGVTGHGARFARIAREYLSANFAVLAPDLRGHGHSGWEPPWGLETHLDDLLETVPADAQLWVGHSFGGRLVLELAARFPERVGRALLLDPALWLPPPVALREAEALRADVGFASLEQAVDARLASGFDHGATRPVMEEDFRAHLERAADGSFAFRYCRSAAIAVYGELARTPPLGPLEVPVRIARAAQSPVCPPELIDAVRESAGGLLSDVELPGGHTPMWDAPAETAACIEAFMAEGRG